MLRDKTIEQTPVILEKKIKISLSALLSIITKEMTNVSNLEMTFEAFLLVMSIKDGFMEGKCTYDPVSMEILSITRNWESLIKKQIKPNISDASKGNDYAYSNDPDDYQDMIGVG